MITGYDLIGDIHGHHGKLVSLLRSMDYRDTDGAWRHPGRQAIFVGDLVDRGPEQVATAMLVRRMVDAGHARCLMGNHEFNAVAWITPDPDLPGEFLRPHSKAGNRHQHAAFLAEVEGRPIHRELTDWFRTLPLWIEEPGLRVVHACWHALSIAWLDPRCSPEHVLHSDLYVAGSRKGNPAYAAIETVCKGIEVPLPEDCTFVDKDGTVRREVRIRWWETELSTYRQAAIGPPELTERMPDLPFPETLRPQPYEGPPVFFGHYWLTGEPRVLGKNAVCLDYSVGKGGPLIAYRWEGEQRLKAEGFRSTG